MEDSGIGSAAWFFSSVVLAIAVNIASAYLKPRLDTLLLRTSAWWREQSEARIAARRRAVHAIADDLNTAYLRALAIRGVVLERYAVALIFFCFGTVGTLTLSTEDGRNGFGLVGGLAGIMCVMYAFGASDEANAQFRLIREAEALKARDARASSSAPPASTRSTS